MKIFVTDGNNRASLSITRSLGKKGHTIIVGEQTQPSLASSSKYCNEKVKYPNPTNKPDEFLNFLVQLIQEQNIDVLLPVSDVTTIPICEHKKILEQYCNIPFADPDTIKAAGDKSSLFQIASELGVAIPKTVLLPKPTETTNVIEKLEFPIVIKPSKSRIRTGGGWLATSVKYAENKEELLIILSKESPLAYPILLQERIEGPGMGVFVCYDQGTPICFFSHRRIREKPPSGGVSVLREAIPVSPVAQDFAEKLLNHLHWHGVAMVEFKIDNRDSTPKLMEINGRFWGSLQLAIDAGVDFPALLLEIMNEKKTQPIKNYKVGVRTRWLLGDIDSLLLLLFKNKKQLNLPSDHSGKIQTTLDFFKLWQKNTYYEVLKLSDIRPWFYEFKKWFKKN